MKQSAISAILAFALSGVMVTQSRASGSKAVSPRSLSASDATSVSWAKKALQGFDMKIWLSNQIATGIEAWDPFPVPTEDCSLGIGLAYPPGSCIEHLYGAAPWIGAIVNGVRRVSEGYNGDDARMEFLPERGDTATDRIWNSRIGTSAYDPNGYSGYYFNHHILVNRQGVDDDHDGKTDEDALDGLDNDGDWNPLTDDLGSDGLPDSLEVDCDGHGFDAVTNPDPAYDNYDPLALDKCHLDGSGNYLHKNDRNRYTQNNGIPDHGEPNVDEDFGAASDQDFYTSATDTFHSLIVPAHVPIGAKVFQHSLAWQSATSAGAIIFMEYTFTNIGMNPWQNAYLGMFADMDVGPVDVPSYYTHNYAAYDPATRTAYVHNPIDRGSTPLGLVLLGGSTPADSSRFVFRHPGFGMPGTTDSLIYGWLSGGAFPDQLIEPDQSQTQTSDARVLISFGPFQAQPGDALQAAYAYVSGSSVTDMLNNARRAHRIHESGDFLMPVARISDPGGSDPVTISWDPVARSPYGAVTSYRLYYGGQSGVYTDSIVSVGLSSEVSNLTAGQSYFFAVAAMDDQGNRSALSDELSNAPGIPGALQVNDGQKTLEIRWIPTGDLDLAGYNIYRHTSLDSNELRLNSVLLTTTMYVDSAVWGDRTYFYRVTAMDHDGHEGNLSDEVSGHLLPPATPARFIVGPGKTFVHLNWLPNTESDLAGYNIYRSTLTDTGWRRLNTSVWTSVHYIDSTIGQDTLNYYRIEAVDSTDAVSLPSPEIPTHTVHMDRGILVLNQMSPYPPHPAGIQDSARTFYQQLLRNYRDTVVFGPIPDATTLGNYSTVMLLSEDASPYGTYFGIGTYPGALKGYVLGGGHLFISGRKLTANSFPRWYQFLSEIFGIDVLTQANASAGFVGASGLQGLPSLSIDTVKVSLSAGGSLQFVETFPSAPPARVLYTYNASPGNTAPDGQPVGLRSVDTSLHALYVSFPVYFLDEPSAQSLVTEILGGFGEVTGVSEDAVRIPTVFRAYDAYPNPFNPTATIRFDIPKASRVTLTVYDLLGRMVDVLVDEVKSPGSYYAEWNAASRASGVYFYRIAADELGSPPSVSHVRSGRLVLVK